MNMRQFTKARVEKAKKYPNAEMECFRKDRYLVIVTTTTNKKKMADVVFFCGEDEDNANRLCEEINTRSICADVWL